MRFERLHIYDQQLIPLTFEKENTMATRFSQKVRNQALSAIKAGEAINKVAKKIGCNQLTVRRWLKEEAGEKLNSAIREVYPQEIEETEESEIKNINQIMDDFATASAELDNLIIQKAKLDTERDKIEKMIIEAKENCRRIKSMARKLVGALQDERN